MTLQFRFAIGDENTAHEDSPVGVETAVTPRPASSSDRSLALAMTIIEKLPTEIQTLMRLTASQIVRKIQENGGCPATVCFALENTSKIRRSEFRLQKRLVRLAIALAKSGEDVSFSAVRYAQTTTPVAPGGTPALKVFRKVGNAKRVEQTGTNIAAALGYCGFQVRNEVSERKRTVVLLGSGMSSIGFTPSIIKDVLANDQVSVTAILSAGTRKDFVDNVGLKNNDVIKMKHVYKLAGAMRKLVFRICDV